MSSIDQQAKALHVNFRPNGQSTSSIFLSAGVQHTHIVQGC